jgi:protein involved in polysaccharide export with SLBB domain
MKKAISVALFSLSLLIPIRSVIAQAVERPQSAVEKPSGVLKDPANDESGSQGPVSEVAATESASEKVANASSQKNESSDANLTPAEASSEAQKYYESGVSFYESGKLEAAIEVLKRANKLRPDDAQTNYMLGMVYSKSTDYTDAADSFKRAARLKPDWPEAHFRIGLMAYVLDRRSQSIEEYKKLLKLNSPLANVLYRIIKEDLNAAGVAENIGAGNQPSSVKQVEAIPISAAPKDAPSSANPEPNRIVPTTGSSATALATPVASTTPVPSTTPAAATAPVASATPADPPVSNDSSASTNSPPASEDKVLTGVYKIGVGDILDIRLLNSATTRSTLYSVIDGGVIDFPVAGGPVQVAGLTTEEIQSRIASELKRRAVEDGAHVTVGVRQYASHTVTITGLVNNPGIKILRREAVPLYVIMADAQPRLDAGRVAIMRAGSNTQALDLNAPATLNALIRPGDVINLSARPQEFYYIGGRINYPGQKAFQPGITLLQSILAAGGLVRQSANTVELSREGADGRLTTTKFSLKEIKAGKIEDPKLQPGDRIQVVH